jgi:hypothetical protein
MGQKKRGLVEKIPYRGYNLLEEQIHTNRSCIDAGIPANFCTCLEEKALPRYQKSEDIYEKIFAEILTYLITNFDSCLDVTSLSIEEEEIKALSINTMVRQGWRDMEA